MNLARTWYIFPVALALLATGCNSPGKFTGFSYDPAGATVTTDKPIDKQHRRTIGIAEDGIWISNEFPGGRMNDFYRDDSLYRMVIRPENHPVNNSPWYAFRAWSEADTTIEIQLTYEHGKHRYYPDISKSGNHWQPIDSSQFRRDTVRGTATLTLNLDRKPLFVSAQELFTLNDFHAWKDSLSQKPFVKIDTAGYSHEKRPVYRLGIAEGVPGESKGTVIVISRQHPPEVTGNIACLAFLEEVASGSALAERFRDSFQVIAFPFANPDGVQNGHWRHNAGGVDLNRDWMYFNQPETRAVRDNLVSTVKDDSSKTVYYGIDFHSTDENIFYPIEKEVPVYPDDFTFRWLDSLTTSFPETTFEIEPFDVSSPIAKNWIYHSFGADAVTYEVNDTADRDAVRKIARSGARKMMRMLLRVPEKEDGNK